jgi:geranylgeranyl diphosphate synthase type I
MELLLNNVDSSLHADYEQIKERWKLPFEYQEAQQGKNVRIELTSALAELYGIHGDIVDTVCDVAQKFNAACLMHDDIIDGDTVRRGAPAVWVKYGVAAALISGMYGYLDGLKLLARSGNVDLVKIGLRSLEDMHVGQCLDAQINAGNKLPTMTEYKLISETNTGCLFLLILNIFQALAPAPQPVYQSLKSMLLKLSVHYRFVNDYCDMNHIPWFEKKGFAPDLDGGPKSWLMMLSGKLLDRRVRTDDEKREIIRAYGEQGIFAEAMKEIDIAFEYVMRDMEKVEQQIQRQQWHPEEDGNFVDGKSARLKKLMQRLDFKQRPEDNYYSTLIK